MWAKLWCPITSARKLGLTFWIAAGKFWYLSSDKNKKLEMEQQTAAPGCRRWMIVNTMAETVLFNFLSTRFCFCDIFFWPVLLPVQTGTVLSKNLILYLLLEVESICVALQKCGCVSIQVFEVSFLVMQVNCFNSKLLLEEIKYKFLFRSYFKMDGK